MAIALGCAHDSVQAASGVVSDVSFFTGIPHAFLTFDLDRSGEPVVVAPGGVKVMPGDEYARHGLVFQPEVWWGNEADPLTDQVQALGGSPEILLQNPGEFDWAFTVPVYAFGFWMISSGGPSALRPEIVALGTGGLELGRVVFGPDVQHGAVGSLSYGFVGIVSDSPIAGGRIEHAAFSIDNLHFTSVPQSVPEPNVTLLFGMGALIAAGCQVARRR